jgi:hypothetical protein
VIQQLFIIFSVKYSYRCSIFLQPLWFFARIAKNKASSALSFRLGDTWNRLLLLFKEPTVEERQRFLSHKNYCTFPSPEDPFSEDA